MALAVFLAVPRGVTVGEVSVSADRMSWNTTKATYQLRLRATVPVFNPNYLAASIEGRLQVFFYQTEAGWAEVGPARLPPRAAPQSVDVTIDASDVPSDYILAILSQCSTFPEVLVFFLKGRLTVRGERGPRGALALNESSEEREGSRERRRAQGALGWAGPGSWKEEPGARWKEPGGSAIF